MIWIKVKKKKRKKKGVIDIRVTIQDQIKVIEMQDMGSNFI